MRTGKDIHLIAPVFLLEQISRRAIVAGRTRAAEGRYLLKRGLELAGDSDILITIPVVQTRRDRVSPPYDIFDQVLTRSERFERSVATEALRLIAYAIEASATTNLDAITSMRSRTDQSPHGTQRIASLESLPG